MQRSYPHGSAYSPTCRLLTEVQPYSMDGWTSQFFNNWTEPNQWKNGKRYTADYKCYEKATGWYPIHVLIKTHATKCCLPYTCLMRTVMLITIV